MKIFDSVSDSIALVVGSWYFIITQTTIILFWVLANTIGLPYVPKWDPYPFIFLNLALSFQAAYTAPIIMMSQNRQAAIDREEEKADHEINKLAELEIELLQREMVEIKKLFQQHADIEEDIREIKHIILSDKNK